MINRLQEALEGTRDRESHLAERVAASVADGHRSFLAFGLKVGRRANATTLDGLRSSWLVNSRA